MTPLLSADALEALAFNYPGSTIERDPSTGTRHLLDINGREVAWAVAPADVKAAAGLGAS